MSPRRTRTVVRRGGAAAECQGASRGAAPCRGTTLAVRPTRAHARGRGSRRGVSSACGGRRRPRRGRSRTTRGSRRPRRARGDRPTARRAWRFLGRPSPAGGAPAAAPPCRASPARSPARRPRGGRGLRGGPVRVSRRATANRNRAARLALPRRAPREPTIGCRVPQPSTGAAAEADVVVHVVMVRRTPTPNNSLRGIAVRVRRPIACVRDLYL